MPGQDTALFQHVRRGLVGGQPELGGLGGVVGADRAEFGHAPAVLDLDAVLVAEGLDQQWRRGGPAGHDALDGFEAFAAGAEVLQQPHPDRGARRR